MRSREISGPPKIEMPVRVNIYHDRTAVDHPSKYCAFGEQSAAIYRRVSGVWRGARARGPRLRRLSDRVTATPVPATTLALLASVPAFNRFVRSVSNRSRSLERARPQCFYPKPLAGTTVVLAVSVPKNLVRAHDWASPCGLSVRVRRRAVTLEQVVEEETPRVRDRIGGVDVLLGDVYLAPSGELSDPCGVLVEGLGVLGGGR